MARLSTKPFVFVILLGLASLLQAQNETNKPAVIGSNRHDFFCDTSISRY
jgi:hypothetical protein